MKLFMIFLILAFSSCQTKEQNNKEKKDNHNVFEIKSYMITSFNPKTLEIQLDRDSSKKCGDIDIAKYNYVTIEGFLERIPLLKSTVAFTLPDVIIYITDGKICSTTGLIKLETWHLDTDDNRIIKLKQVLEKYVK